MDVFNKVIIKTAEQDIKLVDGENLHINNASYFVRDGCLYIESDEDDLVIALPYGEYSSIDICTECGNCVIEFKKATIGQLCFTSEVGDLTLNAYCEDVSFNSEAGDFIRKKGMPNRQIINRKKTMTVKEIKPLDSSKNESWKNGERYR